MTNQIVEIVISGDTLNVVRTLVWCLGFVAGVGVMGAVLLAMRA